MTADNAAPPATGGRAARLGLVRSVSDRRIAGVGAAMGNATGTDPLLWRVLLAVLTVFAGAGVVLYLLCWLVFPAEGDQTSPLGAMVSSKTSTTSRFVTALLSLLAILVAIVTIVSTDGRPFLLLGLVVTLVVVLARRRGTEPAPAPVPEPASPLTPVTPVTTATLRPEQYAAPFAPHGPYASRTLDLPAEPPPLPLPPPPAPPPRAPARRQRRSALGLVCFSLVVILIGVAAILDMVGVSVPMGWTLSGALLICGGGLLSSTWFGRARGLIPLGIVLALALGVVSFFGQSLPTVPLVSQYSSASTVEAIPGQLTANIGDSELDVSAVKFTDSDEAEVSVNIWVGRGTIVVPENVDVIVEVDHQHSRVVIDGELVSRSGDRSIDEHTSTGADGEGGGELIVSAVVEAGSLEIKR